MYGTKLHVVENGGSGVLSLTMSMKKSKFSKSILERMYARNAYLRWTDQDLIILVLSCDVL